MPELSGMPLSISISNPNGSASACRSAISAAPAVLAAACLGRSTAVPRIAAMRTSGASMRRTVTVSPTPATA